MQPKYRRVQLLDSDDDEQEEHSVAGEDTGAEVERSESFAKKHTGGDPFIEAEDDDDADYESLTAVDSDVVSACTSVNNLWEYFMLSESTVVLSM